MSSLSENEDPRDSESQNFVSKRLRSSPKRNESAASCEHASLPSTTSTGSNVEDLGNVANATNREEDMDGDDVEFLFTVPPPSSRVNTGSVAHEADTLAEACPGGGSHDGMQFEAIGTQGEPLLVANASSSAGSSAIQHSPQRQPYAPVTSAYVQSLAEVSFVLLHDTRWKCRTPSGARRPLFQWEHGDDLAVMLWFARRYQPDQAQPSTATSASCACLLCRDIKKPSASWISTLLNEPEPANRQAKSPEDRRPRHAQLDEDEGESDRSLYLYARLFYRKGPWFRLDDVFWKYYADIVRSSSVEKENHQPSDVNESRLERLCLALESLLMNVECLQSKGLLRTFLDEAECGRVCDTSLFKKEERSIVLSKLGIRKPTGKPNEVWTQMRTQHSLFGKPRDGILLPVRKIVAETLKSRLLQSIVQACSPNYLPASTMKELVSRIAARFPNVSLYGCIRLRESPTLTLRRAVRLFVCATAGPGEMRGTANGWTSLRNTLRDPAPPLSQLIPPPGIQCFNMVVHPGLMTRFGRQSTLFQLSYKESTANSDSFERHVFRSRESFVAWEMAVELRAQVDYLLELIETLRSNERRKNRGLQPRGERQLGSSEVQLPKGSVDFWSLLSGKRGKVVAKLLSGLSNDLLIELLSSIDEEVEGCLAAAADGESLLEGERVLISITVTCLHVLLFRCRTMESNESSAMMSQPWLRHLFWESVLAYVLWDIIPILERRELYRLAAKVLETLLFGSPLGQECKSDGQKNPIFPTTISHFPLAPVLLSRRARGKAYDRLIIDHNHILSQDIKKSNIAKEEFKARRDDVLRFCEVALVYSLGTSAISFSSIRCLARRLKRPLVQTVGNRYCVEAAELGLRYESNPSDDKEDKRYRDWTPIVDTAVANALSIGVGNESGALAGRCAFVGFEDTAVDVGSLNVEQLAMEYYRTGRFEIDNSAAPAVAGGWVGWHDEGSHIRALFRILCAPVLGTDGSCQASAAHCASLIVLSPYQQAPFDLHVGFSVSEGESNELVENKTANSVTGFFYHRRDVIDSFLNKLSLLTPQELCDLVHESIAARQAIACKYDVRFEQDCSRSRTLSLIAAGCGGPLLSSMFRCLFFDYRHYSGGLPDLLLVRATRASSNPGSEADLVRLEEWICEGTFLNSSSGPRTFEDDEFLGCSKSGDSASTTRATSSRSKRPNPVTTESNGDKRVQDAPDVDSGGDSHKLPLSATGPERLQLVYDDKPVFVECIMVEVKSSNDRLDPRQEDWLNVIDRHGRARVCKFTATPSVKSAGST